MLLTDPHILILDEPTSSVDADTERRMQQALQEVWAGRTTFVIAHRLWTIQQADQILVLRKGRIVEQGRRTATRSAHESLLAADGFYRELYELQFQGETLSQTETPAQPATNAVQSSRSQQGGEYSEMNERWRTGRLSRSGLSTTIELSSTTDLQASHSWAGASFLGHGPSARPGAKRDSHPGICFAAADPPLNR